MASLSQNIFRHTTTATASTRFSPLSRGFLLQSRTITSNNTTTRHPTLYHLQCQLISSLHKTTKLPKSLQKSFSQQQQQQHHQKLTKSSFLTTKLNAFLPQMTKNIVSPAIGALSTGLVLDTTSPQHNEIIITTQNQNPPISTPQSLQLSSQPPLDPVFDDVLYYIRRRIRQFMNWLTPQTYVEWKSCIIDLANAVTIIAGSYIGVFILSFFTIDFFDIPGAFSTTLSVIESTSMALKMVKNFSIIATAVYLFELLKNELDAEIEESLYLKHEKERAYIAANAAGMENV